ncbi:MAG: thioredoxin family protein [Bacteroidia bacterium]
MGVLIVAGSWCSDTKLHLPALIKVLNECNVTNEKVLLYFVDFNKKTDVFDAKALQIELIPTFIFYKNGKEIGRIIETPKVSIEDDLLKILNN